MASSGLTSRPAETAPALTELEKFQREVEKKVFKENSALSTRVESWILEEGQKLSEPINFNLWSTNIETADKDLSKFFKNSEFEDFKKSCDTYLSDPKKKVEFIKIFAEKLQGQLKIRQQGKVERAKVSEKVDKDLLADTLKSSFNKFDKWKNEGAAGYAKMAGTGLLLYFVVFKGIKAVWKGLKGVMAGDSVIKSLATGGLLIGGGAYLLKETLLPKSAIATEAKTTTKPAAEQLTSEQERIQAIIEDSDNAQALMGLLQTPTENVLKAYKNSKDNQIDPKFLLSHIKGVKGFDRKWTREMVKKINPTTLYETVHSTIKLFQNSAGYQEELSKKDPIGLPEYIHREYVEKAKKSGTVIEFPELLADALEIVEKTKDNFLEIPKELFEKLETVLSQRMFELKNDKLTDSDKRTLADGLDIESNSNDYKKIIKWLESKEGREYLRPKTENIGRYLKWQDKFIYHWPH